MRNVVNLLGYNVLDESVDSLSAEMVRTIDEGDTTSVIFLNPHSIVLAASDEKLGQAIQGSTTIVCDGIGLWLAGVILNRKRIHRIRGYDFFAAVSCELNRTRQRRVFFLGGTPGSLRVLSEKYARDFPGISHVGSYSPPYKAEFTHQDIQLMADAINASRAHVVWVGLGSPKQEKVLRDLLSLTDVRLIAAIGAVFDFYAGTIGQAPRIFQVSGMEWVYRLIKEPRRLWRRTLISAPLFLLMVARSWIAELGSR